MIGILKTYDWKLELRVYEYDWLKSGVLPFPRHTHTLYRLVAQGNVNPLEPFFKQWPHGRLNATTNSFISCKRGSADWPKAYEYDLRA